MLLSLSVLVIGIVFDFGVVHIFSFELSFFTRVIGYRSNCALVRHEESIEMLFFGRASDLALYL